MDAQITLTLAIVAYIALPVIAIHTLAYIVDKLHPITYLAPEVSDFDTWKHTRGHVILKETR